MAKQIINIGSTADDGTGSTIRAGGDLINDNFNEIYTELGDGSTLSIASKTQTLTNKTLDGSNNTFSNIPGSALTNATFTLVDESSTEATISLGERMGITGGTNLTTAITGDNINVTLNTTITGLTSLQTETLTNASGNLLVDSATYITEFRGDGSSTRGQIQLNCEVNTHGQKIVPQPHSEGVTNTLTLPAGADQELVGTIDTQTLTNKTLDGSNNTLSNIGNSSLSNSTITIADDSSTTTTIGLGETLKIAGSGITTSISGDTITLTGATLSYSKGTAIGDGSTTAFTINSGRTVDDILVYVNGICLVPTDDYTISGTTLTFATAPAASAEITFRYLPV
jgi:hypothetical protein